MLAIAGWIGAIGAGLGILMRYQGTASAAASAPARWPADTTLPPPTERPLLLLVVHPHCPCSRASLIELAAIVEASPRPPQVLVLFMRPPGTADGWERTELWERAQRLPGASVRVDVDGREAARFGARTSGQTFVYGPGGELRFAGGITPGRGETGDSAGRQRVLAALRDLPADGADSAVFGCSLGDES
jgi:hypothetical protein